MKEKQRKIIHIDMDAFFASVEQRDFPEYRNKPVAVGGNEERGVISAASYEARKFGVRSAMSSKKAKQLCPDLIFAKHRFDAYKKVSTQIREIFARYSDLIEPLSFDEAFLDVTDSPLKSATFIAKQIKNDILEELNLVASAGVSYNKFLAKVASDQDKPNGLFIIPPEDGLEFTKQLPIKDFFGVGKVTAEKMKEHGIFYGKDLLKYSIEELTTYFGKSGAYFYSVARGIDLRPVKVSRERKSLGAERTFINDILSKSELRKEMVKVADILWGRYENAALTAKTVSIKIKFNDFTQITRAKTGGVVKTKEEVLDRVMELFHINFIEQKPVRLLGATVSGFVKEENIKLEKEFVKSSLEDYQLKFF